MIKHSKISRDLPEWAGSSPDDLLISNYDIAEEMKATSWKRLYEIKNKLVDQEYLQRAIASLADMLSQSSKGKDNER